MLRQHGAQILGNIAHVGEIGNAAYVKPVPELADAHLHLTFRHTGLDERFGHLLARHADERRLCFQIGAHLAGKLVARIINGKVERNRHLFSTVKGRPR